MALGDFFFTEAAVSAPFQLVMFSVAGIGGYLYMGNKVGRSSVVLLRFLGSPQLRLPDFCYRWMGCCSLTESVPFHSLSGEDCGMMVFFPKQMAL